jgi:predicted polyphosphate/ATP-dependent NAD kinase
MNVDLIIFVGGDGTAQNVYSVIGKDYPMLGVPSGVKIHSGVFAQTAEKASEIVKLFAQNQVEFVDGEIIDLNEDAYREGKLQTQLYGIGLTPKSPSYMQLTKSSNYQTDREEDNIQGIINTLNEEITLDTLYFLGSGSTIKKISIAFNKSIQDQKTLLGIDAVLNNHILKTDLSESDILNLIKNYPKLTIKFLITPIGGQGFILGRGNQQISPQVIKTVGINAFYIIATRSKIDNLSNRLLHIDTGDIELDKGFFGYHKVLVDYNEYWMVKIE